MALAPALPLLDRGVYRAPCFGPDGETILFAVTSEHRLIPDGSLKVQQGGDCLMASATLWRLLDAFEPAESRRASVRRHTLAQTG